MMRGGGGRGAHTSYKKVKKTHTALPRSKTDEFKHYQIAFVDEGLGTNDDVP